MQISIVGAGISGLAASLLLQKQGLKPLIYEERETAGDFPARAEASLNVLTKPAFSVFRTVNRKFGLKIKPGSELRRIVFHTATARAEVRGKLGHIIIRGRDRRSLDNQLYAQLNTKIYFNRRLEPDQITAQSQYVLNATGEALSPDGARAISMQSALLMGDFEPQTMHIWRDSAFTSCGYGYLIPFSHRLANLFLIAPQTITTDLFVDLLRALADDLGFWPDVLRMESMRKNTGPVKEIMRNNVFALGNSLGAIRPMLGLDFLIAFESAHQATASIAHNLDYRLRIRPLARKINQLYTIQRKMENWPDTTFDILLTLITAGGTPFFNSRLDLMKAVDIMLRPLPTY